MKESATPLGYGRVAGERERKVRLDDTSSVSPKKTKKGPKH